jgi:MFS family permease
MQKIPDETDRIGFSAWWMAVVLTAMYVLSFFDRNLLSLVVDPVRSGFQLTDVEVSLVLGPAFGIVYAIVGMPLGWAADRLDRRVVIFSGIFTWSLATLATGLVTSFTGLAIARMFVAIGEAALTPAAVSLLSDRFPTRRVTVALSLYNIGPKSGISLAFLAGGLMLGAGAATSYATLPLFGQVHSWQVLFIPIGILGALFALLVFTFKEPPRRQSNNAEKALGNDSFFGHLSSHKQFYIPFAIAFCLLSIASASVQLWTPTFITRHFGVAPREYGPPLGIITGIAAFGLPVMGVFVDWVYDRGVRDAPLRVYTWILMIAGPTSAYAFFSTNLYFFLILFGLLLGIISPYMMYASAGIKLIAPSELRGRLVAGMLFLASISGLAIGPTVVAAVTEHVLSGPASLGTSLGIVMTICIVISLVLLRFALAQLRTLTNTDVAYRVAAPSIVTPNSAAATE